MWKQLPCQLQVTARRQSWLMGRNKTSHHKLFIHVYIFSYKILNNIVNVCPTITPEKTQDIIRNTAKLTLPSSPCSSAEATHVLTNRINTSATSIKRNTKTRLSYRRRENVQCRFPVWKFIQKDCMESITVPLIKAWMAQERHQKYPLLNGNGRGGVCSVQAAEEVPLGVTGKSGGSL